MTVLVMSPGAHPFERFGHAALRVDEPGHRGADALVYNYGTFDGSDPHLVRHFLAHTMPFWLSQTTWNLVEDAYARRRITELELDLDEGEARALANRLADNALPEHRLYVYEFFSDNCSTRVRDMVATALPALAATQHEPGHRTLREHVRDVLRPVPLYRRAIDLALNARVDEPTTRWDDAFLPRELAGLLRELHREGGRPLVRRETLWTGAEYRDLTVERSPWLDLLWLLLLAPLALAALDGALRPVTRALAGVGLALFGLVTGVVGAGIVITSLTPYDVAHANGNIVALWPATLVLVPYGVRLLLRGRLGLRAVGVQRARAALVALAAPIAIDLAAHLLGRAQHQHVALLLFVLTGHALGFLALRHASPHEHFPVDHTQH